MTEVLNYSKEKDTDSASNANKSQDENDTKTRKSVLPSSSITGNRNDTNNMKSLRALVTDHIVE